MDDWMFYVRLALRWLHIGPAIVLLGGLAYLRFVQLPAAEAFEKAERERLEEETRLRWTRLVMICAGLLLLSGIINAGFAMVGYVYGEVLPDGRGSLTGLYHGLTGLKFLLAIAVLYIASMLSGSSENAQSWRERHGFWLNVALGLALAIVLAGGVMRMLPRSEKPTHAQPSVPSEADS